MNHLWGGRFKDGLDPEMEEFNQSLQVDKRMFEEDIVASKVYAEGLYETNLITAEEKQKIIDNLSIVLEEWKTNKFIIKNDEDIHTANERRLKELIGNEIGGKLHTGRSRNDQVATDVRLWLIKSCNNLKKILKNLIQTIVKRAESDIDIIFPGYTHLQRAQPVLWSHFLLSYAYSFKKDLEYLNFVIESTNVCPLGSGALAGNPFDINRELIAKRLGFIEASHNSMQSVSDRDFIVQFQNWASLCSLHSSRLAEDLIIYSTKEFNFVVLSDAYSTGSSIMPQKKNPDSLELIRGRSGKILGNNFGFMVSLKGLPSTYNKDLQQDKEVLFDSYDTISKLLSILSKTIETLSVNKDKCLEALSYDMLATDLAYYLVKKGLAFRIAHELAGKVVLVAEKYNGDLSKVKFEEFQQISKLFEKDILNIWDYEKSVNQYNAKGGTGKISVQQQVDYLKKWLEEK